MRANHRRGLTRVFALSLGAAAGIGTCAAHSAAEAKITESSMEIGHELEQLGDLLEERHVVRINGETMYVAAGHTEQTYESVLDRVESHCHDHQSTGGAWWEAFQKTLEAKGQLAGKSSPLSVFRRDANGQGVVICLARSDSSPETMLEAAAAFAETGDLGKLGKLRYTYASRVNGGTSVVTMWTDGPFSLNRMLPADTSEPPGTDSNLAPRPPDSQRLLSAELEDTSYGVRVYQAKATPPELIAYYDERMKQQGWLVLTHDGAKAEGRGYMKEGIVVALSVAPDPNGGSVVSLGDLGARGGEP